MFLPSENGSISRADEDNGQLIGDYMKQFAAWLDQFQLSPGTRTLYMGSVRLFLKTINPATITAEDVNTFLKDHPRIYYKTAVKKYLDYRGLNYKIARIKEPARKPRTVPILNDLAVIMLKIRSENPQIYYILKTAINTGSRISEILSLKFGDLRDNEIIFQKTKTGEPRICPVSPDEVAEIRYFASDDVGALAGEHVFYRNCQKTKTAYNMFRVDVEVLKGLSPEEKKIIKKTHNFRRAIINRILELSGGNVMEAQAFIGHGDPKTTLRYMSELQKNEAIQRAFKRLIEGRL